MAQKQWEDEEEGGTGAGAKGRDKKMNAGAIDPESRGGDDDTGTKANTCVHSLLCGFLGLRCWL